jgi:hypothetical protein
VQGICNPSPEKLILSMYDVDSSKDSRVYFKFNRFSISFRGIVFILDFKHPDLPTCLALTRYTILL